VSRPAPETPSWVDRVSLEDPPARPAAASDAARPSAAAKIYIVKSGDTLTRLAERDGSTLSELAKLNGTSVKKLSNLRVGQKIKLKNGIR
jgi:LysM repeat protein